METQTITTEKVLSQKPSEDRILLEQLSEIGAEIEMKLDAELERKENEKGGPYPHDEWNWASEIHHPCKKNLVHTRLDWTQKKPMDLRALWRIKEGNEIERQTKANLSIIGFELIENQKRFTLEESRISGRIDGLAPLNRKLGDPFASVKTIPAEIKSINPNYWDSTKTIDDIRSHRGWWIRKYPAQLNLYNLMNDCPGGFLILVTFGKRPRVLPMLLDYDLADADIKMAESVNKHVAERTYPDPIPFDPQICGMCSFSHLCLPIKMSQATVEISQAETIELEIYLEAKKERDLAEKEFERWKSKLIGNKKTPGRYFGQTAFINDIEISSKELHRKGHTVQETDYVVTTIERVGE